MGKSKNKTGEQAAWPVASCSVRDKHQVAPFELPLISFPRIEKKKKKLSRTIFVPERREEKKCLKMAGFRRFGRGKNVDFGFGVKCGSD